MWNEKENTVYLQGNDCFIYYFVWIGCFITPCSSNIGISGEYGHVNSLLSGTLGITNLVVLFLFKPVEQIHNLMSEIGQLTIITNSYQEQEALRLLELNADDKKTIGEAAVHINNAAANSVSILEKYCEIQSS